MHSLGNVHNTKRAHRPKVQEGSQADSSLAQAAVKEIGHPPARDSLTLSDPDTGFWDALQDADPALAAFVRAVEEESFPTLYVSEEKPPSCACGEPCNFREVPSLDDYIWVCADLKCMFFKNHFDHKGQPVDMPHAVQQHASPVQGFYVATEVTLPNEYSANFHHGSSSSGIVEEKFPHEDFRAFSQMRRKNLYHF